MCHPLRDKSASENNYGCDTIYVMRLTQPTVKFKLGKWPAAVARRCYINSVAYVFFFLSI